MMKHTRGAWIALAFGVTAALFVVRLGGVVEPMGPDQGVYATIGWGLGRGLTLYRDLWEQKPPAIYLTYRAAFAVFGTRVQSIFWLDFIAALATAAFVFDLTRRLRDASFAAITLVVFAFASWPAARFILGGFLERSVSETFITPLAAGAAWAVVVGFDRPSIGWPLLAGLLVGFAGCFKQTALIYWPVLAVWTWTASEVRRAMRVAVWMGIGAAMVPALMIAWLWAHGALGDAWVALVEFNMAYLRVGGVGMSGTLNRFAHELWLHMKTDEVWAVGALAAVVAAGYILRLRTIRAALVPWLGLLWFAGTLIAVVANGPRLFPTYFMPSLVPLSLLSAWLIDRTMALSARRAIATATLALFVGFMLVRSGSIRRAASMIAWDARYVSGALDRDAYLGRFRSREAESFSAEDNARLADYVRAHTVPDDRIFVFGMSAGTYFLSDRLPASRFLWAYAPSSRMLDRPEFRLETLADSLGRVAPRYIVLQRHNGDSFSGWRAEDAFGSPAMQSVLRAYHQDATIGDFVLYRREASAAGAFRSDEHLAVDAPSAEPRPEPIAHEVRRELDAG